MFEIHRRSQNESESSVTDDLPTWVRDHNDTVKAAYEAAVKLRDSIKHKISANESLSKRERQLSIRKLSETVGKNASYLNVRDYPEFVEFVQSTNVELEALFEKRNRKPEPDGDDNYAATDSKHIRKMPRSELLTLAIEQKEQIKKLEDETLTAQLFHMIDAGLMDNQARSAMKIQELKKEIDRLNDRLQATEKRCADQEKLVTDLTTQKAELTRQLTSAGIRTKPDLRGV